jgi:thiamine-monophosphate kinase
MTANRKKHSATPLTEDRLLSRIRKGLSISPAARPQLRLAIGDDGAVFRPRNGFETILTCDWFLEGTHFLPNRHPPDSVGWKCLARAASDLAAMGAEPRCFVLSLALPVSATGIWLNDFLHGLRAASRRLNCPAAGGDTTRGEKVLINVTVVGECRRGRVIFRHRAKPGDAIFVSGRLGEAEQGLRFLGRQKGPVNRRDPRLRKHLYPQPRLAIGAWLAEQRLATAMMDLSDGVSSDLPRLCDASGVGARIQVQRIPSPRLSDLEAKTYDAVELSLHGGDDYELLFTVAPENISRIPRSIAGTSLTLIGEVLRGKNILLLKADGKEVPLARKGWDPFRT